MLPRPDSVLPDTSCNNTNYPTDLTDAQWALIGPLLPPPDTSGAPRTTNPRHVVNAMLYRLKTGCQWKMIPRDFGIPWKTIYNWHEKFVRLDTWRRVQEAMLAPTRVAMGARREPLDRRAGLADRQIRRERRADGLRRGQDAHRPQAPRRGRQPGPGGRGGGDPGERAGRGGGRGGAGATGGAGEPAAECGVRGLVVQPPRGSTPSWSGRGRSSSCASCGGRWGKWGSRSSRSAGWWSGRSRGCGRADFWRGSMTGVARRRAVGFT